MQLRVSTLTPVLLGLVFLAGCSATQPPVLPTDQNSSAPSPSLPATPVPASTLAPTATPKPIVRAPLTGLAVDNAELISRRPLVVKLGNSEDERPQSGLAKADVVYESVTEGGITRYAAVFQSQDASTIGPVRSARLSDLQIAPEFNAVLAHVGASAPIMTMLRGGGVLDLDQFFWQSYYHRITSRVAPYNVYTSTSTLRQGAAARGFSADAPLASYTFQDTLPDQGSDQTIDFNFAPETHTSYVYNSAAHAYHQVEYGAPTADAETKAAVNITNLVIQFVPMTPTNIVEDANGIHSLDYDMSGSGKVAIFHDGQEFDGTWNRARLSDRTSFADSQGKPIALARGATWIALVAPNTPITVRTPASAPANVASTSTNLG